MAVEHSSLTGADLHEPKGAASANSGDVYVSDGAGSGVWKDDLSEQLLHVTMPTISDSIQVGAVVCPVAGTITKIFTVTNGAFFTANTVITTYIDSIAITTGTVTITQSGSASRDVDSTAPTAANAVTAGQVLWAENDGAATDSVNSIAVDVMFVIDVNV